MNDPKAPYGRIERLVDRVDFAWQVSGSLLRYIGGEGLWMTRFRPGGPHGLWIAGHLTYYEAGALKLYTGLDSHPLADWKERFGNGRECLDDPAAYSDPAGILTMLEEGREAIRKVISAMSDADLDASVPPNERLRIRDVQSQIEFLIWHDSHHAAQLGAIVNTYKQGLAG